MTTRTKEVTTPADERFVSRSGTLQVNTYEVARNIEARLTPAQREEQARGRVSLDGMEHALRALRERELDRESSVTKLQPMVAEAERKVSRLKEDLAHAQEAERAHLQGARIDRIHFEIKLKFGEDQLAAVKVRYEISVKILGAIKTAILEWQKVNGSKLAEMRKLTYAPRVGDKF